MEHAFQEDFSSVRVRRDEGPAQATGRLGAVAITRGDEISLAANAPALGSEEGRHLVSHELAHVVQQRRAGNVRAGELSRPGDAQEREADAAAMVALEGGNAAVAAPASVPGAQAQFAGRGVNEQDLPLREDVQKGVEKFLKRALKAQKTRTLTISNAIWNALMGLAQADDPRAQKGKPDGNKPMRVAAVEQLLGGSHPTDPAGLAAAVAKLLPSPFDKAALDALEGRSVEDPRKKPADAMGELVRRTTAPKPDFKDEPGGNAPADRSEKNRKIESDVMGEHSFPVVHSQAIDIAMGTPAALKGRVDRPDDRPAFEDDEEQGAGAARDEAGQDSGSGAAQRPAPAGAFGNIALPDLHLEFSSSLPTVLDEFTPGSAALTDVHRTQLAGMVDMMLTRLNPEILTEIEIVGHADTSGTEASNKRVALQRAEAVRKHLVGTLSVSHIPIIAVRGAGELVPAGKARDAAVRARNRSVEVIVRMRPRPRPKSPFGWP